ncbi:hypothetical protein NCAS_0F01630 [Naumovozyma castellii]|uniref:Uncharacterized protein n=1 Tax=Naumovozyma castellii TaxID=27288 RepID=G0VGM6_NAUCA|nr:hypothetical protein NCAS_0F01630 [Naumovozyma castellii CBS 4309]CCC70647.1 hypothetical protein NCAS_0F01630 [Naumovozyma castellii CBS 4309]
MPVEQGMKVYAFGSNGNYQLGLPQTDADFIVPQLTFMNETALKKIACGGNHTLMLMADGTCYGTGDNSMREIRDDTGTEILKGWHLLNDSESRYKDVTCGWEFTVICNSQNEILSRGIGGKGELGLGGMCKSDIFKKVMAFGKDDEVKLFSSFQNCCVLVNTGTKSTVYGWGSNMKCQLFEPRTGKKVDQPIKIFESTTDILDYVSMGKDFIVFVNKLGQIVDIKGNIPKGFQREEWLRADQKGIQVSCMWSSIHILKEGKIYSYGYGTFGQIFQNEENRSLSVEGFTTGSEHGILVLPDKHDKTQQVSCWGWGEHGNCGRLQSQQESQQEDVNDYSNMSSPLNTVMSGLPNGVRIFGGCSSTWIVVPH